MDQKTSLVLLIVAVLGFGGFILYDAKVNKRFSKEDAKENWQWSDDWNKTNPTEKPKEQPKTQPKAQPKEGVVVGTYAEALKKSEELGLKIMVFFEADWCGWCKKMKQETLSDAKVKEALKKYVVVYVNADKDKALTKKFGVRYLPSYAITNSKEEVLNTDGGFKSPEQFTKWLTSEPDKKSEPKTDPKADPKADPSKPEKERPKIFRRPKECSEINPEE